MPRILIAGCGYVGEATADLFQKAGWKVEGWTVSKESAEKLSTKPYPIRAVDISDRDQVAASAEDFDAVIHCASTRGGNADLYRRIYLDGARNLIARFTRSTFLFTSSTSVYAQKNGELVTEESAAEPSHETGKVLREAEEVVLKHGGIVVRLAGIYGPGRSSLLRKFLGGQARIDAANDRFINQVHRDDIASALFFLLNRTVESQKRTATARAIFNIVADRPTLERECYEWLATRLHRPLPGATASPPARKRGDSNKRVSNEKLRTLGWEPRYPSFQAGMSESVLPNFERLGA
jgi:nucleoside-diphosphate-sugar epimerase